MKLFVYKLKFLIVVAIFGVFACGDSQSLKTGDTVSSDDAQDAGFELGQDSGT